MFAIIKTGGKQYKIIPGDIVKLEYLGIKKGENIVFDKDELYFVIEIENNSTLDYDLNFLNLSIETRQKGKRKAARP